MNEASAAQGYVRPADQDDSLEVHRHRWTPSLPEGQAVRGAVYLLHGTGEHAARYDRLAQLLVADGWAVAAHDHVGHGRSGGPRGRIPIPGSYATRAAIEFGAFAEEIGCKPFLFGHSLGGVIAAELVLLHRLPVSGLLLSAPAVVPKLTWQNRLQLKLFSLLIPTYAVNIPYDPSHLTHDPEQQRIASADPLNHGFKSAEFVSWLMAAAHRLEAAPAQLDVDTLLMIAADDRVIDIARTQAFAAGMRQDLLTVHTYEGAYHEILNEVPEIRQRAADDILAWLDARS